MNVPNQMLQSVTIAAVERDTGLPKDTLRVWERRYGFPMPERDQFGERLYPQEQVDKLRLLKRLLDHGHRPSKIINQSAENLLNVLNGIRMRGPNAAAKEADPLLLTYINLIKNHRIEELRHSLSQNFLKHGLAHFVTEIIAPLNTLVGEAWSCGGLEIFEEHLYTESLQIILRNAINAISAPKSQPRVLLTTFPQEQHGLGILMAEALFALDGCSCVSLGVQTPIIDIVHAVRSQRADIVALSFSSIMNNNQVIHGLRELRMKLPDNVEIWAGGNHSALRRKSLTGVLVIATLHDIRTALAYWRQRAGVLN